MEEKENLTTAAEEPAVEPTETVENAAPAEEKDSTVELREDYQESKEEPKPKKKKLSKGKIALICIASFILLIGIGIGIFFIVGALTPKPKPVDVDFHNTRPNYSVTFTAEEQALIDSAMAKNASEDTIKSAIAMIYTKANENKIAQPNALTALRGAGSATLGIKLGKSIVKPSGQMSVKGFKVQAGDAFYYQKAARVSECSIDAATSIIAAILNQQERAFVSADKSTYMHAAVKGNAAKINKKEDEKKTIPFIVVGVPKAGDIKTLNKEDFMVRGNYLTDPREITNFKIVKDTIVLKELKEGEKYIEYNATDKYYTCRFSLLIQGEGSDECVKVPRDYLRESANSEDLEYGRFDIVLDVWDNGYAKQMHDDEIWEGTIDVAGTESTTSSNSWYESIFFYDYDETLFTEEDNEKYAGDGWCSEIIAHYEEEIKNAPKK